MIFVTVLLSRYYIYINNKSNYILSHIVSNDKTERLLQYIIIITYYYYQIINVFVHSASYAIGLVWAQAHSPLS